MNEPLNFCYTRSLIMVVHRDIVGNLVSSSILIPKLIDLMNLFAHGKKFSMLVPQWIYLYRVKNLMY